MAKKSNLTLIGLGVLVVLSFLLFMSQITSGADSSKTIIQSAVINDGVQEITMEVSAAGYSPDKIVVEKGVPVRIITNSTEDAGCVRGVMIPEFNINAALEVGQDVIEFTPEKEGTFEYLCQMRMSKGTLEVVS